MMIPPYTIIQYVSFFIHLYNVACDNSGVQGGREQEVGAYTLGALSPNTFGGISVGSVLIRSHHGIAKLGGFHGGVL